MPAGALLDLGQRQNPWAVVTLVLEESLVKSRERVKSYGEVFTPRHMVDKMLDLVANELEGPGFVDKTFLEPSAGDGNFLVAILQHWKEGRIRDIIKQTRAQPGSELAQIYHVIDVYSASRSRRGMMIELAVRDGARRDVEAAAIVAEVDDVRLRRARDLFLACGVPMEEASSRCMLLYAYVFGVSLMNYEKFDSDVLRLKRDIADLIARSHSSAASGPMDSAA